MSQDFITKKDMTPLQLGFSLIELMVALAIGIFLSVGLVLFIQNNTKTQMALTQYTALQDSARTAVNLITDSVKRAGYLGIFSDKTTYSELELSTLNGSEPPQRDCKKGEEEAWLKMIEQPIFGIDHSESMNGFTCLSDKSAGSKWDASLESDILVVRHMSEELITVLAPGTSYFISSIQNAFLFKPTGAAEVPQQDIQEFLENSTPRSMHELKAFAYYVGNSEHSCNGIAIPALYRFIVNSDGTSQHEELVLGIERMHVTYQIEDNSGDFFKSAQYFATQMDETKNIKSLRVNLLARTPCQDFEVIDNEPYVLDPYENEYKYTPTDQDRHFRRRLYTTNITLRNST